MCKNSKYSMFNCSFITNLHKQLINSFKTNYMKTNFFYLLAFLFIFSCTTDEDDFLSSDPDLIFVANEGKFGTTTGSVSVINSRGVIQTISGIGDVVQSLKVFHNKLFVISNNSHKINIYEITEDGLLLPGIEIDTNNSSPREMAIINNKLYFTNWNSQDIKVLNLSTYSIENSIPVDGLPESIVSDGQNLYVGIIMNKDYSDASNVLKVSPSSNQILEIFDVGKGPTSLLKYNDDIYVARTFYDSSWNAYYGTSKITNDLIDDITKIDYGNGIVCGGSVNMFHDRPYRSHDGGIAKLNTDLSIDFESQIGNYAPSNVYSVKTLRDKVYIGTTDGFLKIIDSNSNEIKSFSVGDFPGDIEFWYKN